ncbi:hypothetical protein ISCGN_003131 [Ixodes scapularis]
MDTIFPYSASDQDALLMQLTCRAEECRQLAQLRTAQQQHTAKTRYDLPHTAATYAPGDLVMVWTPIKRQGLADKFLRKYVGPYRVIKQTTPVTCHVEPLSPPADARFRNDDIIHVNRLKKYAQPQPTPPKH